MKAERNLLAEVSNPSIVKLFYSFQDEEFLYLVRPLASRAFSCTPHPTAR